MLRPGTPAASAAIARGAEAHASPTLARGGASSVRIAPSHGGSAGCDAGRLGPEGSRRTSRPEGGSLLLSVALHALVVVALSYAVAKTRPPPPPPSSAMTVSIVDGMPAPQSQAPAAVSPTPPTPVAPLPAPSDETQPVAAPASTPSDAPSPASPTPAPTLADAPVGGARVAIGVKASGADLNPELAAGVGHSIMVRLSNCWARPANAPAGVTSIVRVRFSQDGAIQGDPQVIRVVDQIETPVTAPNPWEAAALDAVRRCSPLGLPVGLYPYWGSVDVQVFS